MWCVDSLYRRLHKWLANKAQLCQLGDSGGGRRPGPCLSPKNKLTHILGLKVSRPAFILKATAHAENCLETTSSHLGFQNFPGAHPKTTLKFPIPNGQKNLGPWVLGLPTPPHFSISGPAPEYDIKEQMHWLFAGGSTARRQSKITVNRI